MRTVEFTVQSSATGLTGAAGDGDLDKGIIEMARTADGQRRFVYWPYGLNAVTARWVTVDDRGGEITDVVESFEVQTAGSSTGRPATTNGSMTSGTR